jgi:PilZ domain
MRKLEYRRPRLVSAFDIEFVVGGQTLYGQCKDSSATGIRAELDCPVAVGCSGLLTLHYHEGIVKRRARIAYRNGLMIGLSFLSNEPDESNDPTQLIALVTNR